MQYDKPRVESRETITGLLRPSISPEGTDDLQTG